jgi:hypothetical protein
MQRKVATMNRWLAGLWIFLSVTMAWAVPGVEQVQAEVQQGRYEKAQEMMEEVLEAHPDSARAHYVYAEILAHRGSFTRAAGEARRAELLDPAIGFTEPEKFRSFEKLLDREQGRAHPSRTSASLIQGGDPAIGSAEHSGGIPHWVWLAALPVVGLLFWRALARGQSASSPLPAAVPPSSAAPANPYASMSTSSYGIAPAPPPTAAPSSGGLLKTGLAVAGGVAAGMMVDELLDHRSSGGVDQLSGLQRNVVDLPTTDVAATELEQRSVDFGEGADWGDTASPVPSTDEDDSGDGDGDGGGWG